ncbi:MAG: hypothetical protein U1E43_07840 [Rhodospirillales bacterium]
MTSPELLLIRWTVAAGPVPPRRTLPRPGVEAGGAAEPAVPRPSARARCPRAAASCSATRGRGNRCEALFTLPPLLRTTHARSTAILTSAAAIQNLMVLAVSPILSRLFSPEEFGVVGLLYAIAAVPATLAYRSCLAVMQTRRQVETISIFGVWACILTTTVLASGVVAIGHFARNW